MPPKNVWEWIRWDGDRYLGGVLVKSQELEARLDGIKGADVHVPADEVDAEGFLLGFEGATKYRRGWGKSRMYQYINKTDDHVKRA